jgi:hypothetical protein
VLEAGSTSIAISFSRIPRLVESVKSQLNSKGSQGGNITIGQGGTSILIQALKAQKLLEAVQRMSSEQPREAAESRRHRSVASSMKYGKAG